MSDPVACQVELLRRAAANAVARLGRDPPLPIAEDLEFECAVLRRLVAEART